MINRREFEAKVVSLAGVCLAQYFLPTVTSSPATQESDLWSQWGGPNRNFVIPKGVDSRQLRKPVFSWQRELGKGHAAPVSDGRFVYSVHLDGDDEVLSKWQLSDGASSWKRECRVGFHASIKEYDGPHATPTIVGNQILIAHIDGQIQSINRSTGKPTWRTDLKNDFGTILPQAGYASSPLVWKNRVIMPTLGEAESAETEYYKPSVESNKSKPAIPGAVALDLKSGKEIWRSETFRSSHGSPILIDVGGQPIVVFHGMFELVGVDPQDGKILFRQLLRRVAADNVSFTPIWDSRRDQILVAHGYCDFGAQAVQLRRDGSRWKTKINWTNNRLQIVHTNAVLLGNLLIGTKRSPATLMTAVDVRDGSTKFRQRGFGKCNLVAIGDELLILDENGELIGARLDSMGLNASWEMSTMKKNAWTAPSIFRSHVAMRDSTQIKVYKF